MKRNILALMMLFLFQSWAFGQQEARTKDNRTVLLYEDGTWLYADSVSSYKIKSVKIRGLEIPKTHSCDKVITHAGYSLLYNEAHEQATWVAYELTKEETNKLFDRTDKFIPDPLVITGTATDKDYEGSGYDRGHLAPAADMGWSLQSVAESFYYSNMSPQAPGFNRGIWKSLEDLVRTWAVEDNNIYIVTGPILKNGLQTIGPDKVSVPAYYYKVILDYTEPDIKSIGFIFPNAGSKEQLQHFAVTVDSVEKLTGLDFFPLLPDNQEAVIEKTLCIPCWSWKNAKTSDKKDEIEGKGPGQHKTIKKDEKSRLILE